MHVTGRLLRLWITAGLAVLMAGCAAEAEPTVPDHYYSEDVTFALENATSDFERQVLADGVVTEAEYDEAHELWLECMEEHFPPGSNYSAGLNKREDGLYAFLLSSPPGVDAGDRIDEFDLLFDACSVGTVEHVAPLYNNITTNPEGHSWEQMVYDCYLDRGMIAEGYTVEDLTEDFALLADGLPQSDQSPMKGLPDDPDAQGCF